MQSWIWYTLPTSKIGLFLTKFVDKDIFSWQLVIYTQHHFMSFFLSCVSLFLVPYSSMLFHLQRSELELFITIAIANVVFYWATVLHVQFAPMNFLFFVSVPC